MPLNFLSTKYIIAIAILLSCATIFSQTKKQRAAFIKDSTYIMRIKLVRPQLRGDNRNILYMGQILTVNGLDAGILLKDKLRLTLGYYSLHNNITAYKKLIDGTEWDREYRLQYMSLNTEFIYKNTRFISLGLPVEFGYGTNSLQYINPFTTEIMLRESSNVFLTDFGLSMTFKPIRWIGLKGVIGYRKTLFNNITNFHFDGAFMSIGLNADIREVIKDVQMFRLKRKYHKNINAVSTAIDLITD